MPWVELGKIKGEDGEAIASIGDALKNDKGPWGGARDGSGYAWGHERNPAAAQSCCWRRLTNTKEPWVRKTGLSPRWENFKDTTPMC